MVVYPVEPPKGIFHFPQGVFCLFKQEDTGKEEVKIKRLSGDEFEFEIIPKDLTEVEQKEFPIRICEIEKGLTEEELEALPEKELAEYIAQEPKTVIKTEKRIDITLNNKHRQILKDGEILKIGNTVSYSAGTNLITLDDSVGAGDSWGTAYDMEDVLSACGAVVTKQGANAYDISARLKFLSGVYFVSKNEFVELKPNPINPDYTIQIDSGAHVKFGEYDSVNSYSYDGSFWRIYTDSITGGANGGNVIFGEWLVYGSNVWNDAYDHVRGIHYKAGATIRMYNSIIRAKSYFSAVDHDLQDTKWFGIGVGSFDLLIASGFNFNWAGLTTMDCSYGLFFSASTTSDVDLYTPLILNSGSYEIYLSSVCNWLIRIINPVVKPTNIMGTGSGKPGCQICYTFNVKVTDGVNPVVGATVELKDKNDDVVFSDQTITGGVLTADKIVKVDWYKHADQGGHLTYGDHTLKVTNGGNETEYQITIDHKISKDIVLIPQATASYDNIIEGINDIKGTSFVKDTDSLVNIRPETNKIQAIKTATDKMNFTGTDIKATLDGEEVTTNAASRTASKATGFATENPPSQILNDYKADVSGVAPANEYDTALGMIAGNVAGLNGDVMRGSDGVPTNPLLTNDVRLNNLDTTISSRADQNPPSQVLNDYKATGFSTPGEYDTVVTDLQADIDELQDVSLGKWVVDPIAKTLTLYKRDDSILKVFTLTSTLEAVPAFIARI